MKIKEVIIVEGKSDSIKVKSAVKADTIETNGSAINQPILEAITHAQRKRGVIIFTDPDYPGTRIRHIIDRAVPGCKHAFITEAEAKATSSKRQSLGIEHASPAAIVHALSQVYEQYEQPKSDITKEDLLHYGLIIHKDARQKRELLGDYLHIGYTNGKQLLKRLTMFNIMKNELDAAMKHIIDKRRIANGQLYCDSE